MFYGVLTLLGYLMPDSVQYIYIYIYRICKRIVYWIKSFLNEPELICLHTVEWFEVFLFNTNSVQYYSFVFT